MKIITACSILCCLITNGIQSAQTSEPKSSSEICFKALIQQKFEHIPHANPYLLADEISAPEQLRRIAETKAAILAEIQAEAEAQLEELITPLQTSWQEARVIHARVLNLIGSGQAYPPLN